VPSIPRQSANLAGPTTAQDQNEGAFSSFENIHEIFRARGGSLLILRLFLGVTFCFAGLQKLANPNFLKASAPGSFVAQLHGAIITSPLHHLLSPALHAPTLIALIISFAELAVGTGTLLGFMSKTAAIGGMLLSLTFFLVVSFHDSPYYYGPDIVFLFAWTPFIISGAGLWSLDTVLARRAIEIDKIRAIESANGVVERRTVLQRGFVTTVVAGAVILGGGLIAALGRSLNSTNTAGSTTTSGDVSGVSGTSAATNSGTTPSSGSGKPSSSIGSAKDVPMGGSANFTDPTTGLPGIVVHPTKDHFAAFSAICPHAGCQVGFDQSADLFVCPCHGSEFNGKTGGLVRGPATRGLTTISIDVSASGDITAND
jgi:thiosulfate dehydrogenase [quinone] large subunit